jgi:hypothetical protein
MFTLMNRKALKIFALASVAVLALGTLAEAAPKKVLHHRARQSARVSAGSVATMHKATHRKRVIRKKTSASRRTVHRHPTTKPR